ncbi:MAG: hypothetical protein AB7O95_01280 [Geminicoccaceae bacterium]
MDPPVATVAVPPDRPLDGYLPDPTAMRTALLIESALAQVRPVDLRRCLDEFGSAGRSSLRPPAHGGWLIVASAQEVGDPGYRRREAALPGSVGEVEDGWLDRIAYRALLRSADPSSGAVACLSCVFGFEGGRLTFRHAYALDTCRRAVPPERDLATVVPLDRLVLAGPDQPSSRTVSSSPSASP